MMSIVTDANEQRTPLCVVALEISAGGFDDEVQMPASLFCQAIHDTPNATA
jgi:hypothetical protein